MAAATTKRNLVTTFSSVMWGYGSRGLGLLWTVVLLHQLGVAEYGQYAMAVAINGIVGVPLDSSFAVRSIRESERAFVQERTCRYLVALVLMAAGACLLPFSYPAGFGLFAAGGEMAFNVVRARPLREGHPDRVARMSAIGQLAGVGPAIVYLYLSTSPTLLVASLFYGAPYVVVALIGVVIVMGHRPATPGPPRLIAALTGEMLGTALYLQGDVLLLGWLTNSTTVGYYQITWIVAAAIAAVGQSFVATYHEPLRASGGDPATGPPMRNTLGIALIGAVLVFGVGVALAISPASNELAITMMIMAAFAGLRVVIMIFQTVLYTQRRDVFRMTWAIGLVPVKFALVALLGWWAGLGAVGTAVAAVLTDIPLLLAYIWALYGSGRKPLQPLEPASTEQEGTP